MTKQEIETRARERAAERPIRSEREAERVRMCLRCNREAAAWDDSVPRLQPRWVSELYARTQEIQLAAWGREAPAKRRKRAKVETPWKSDWDFYAAQRKYHA